MGERIRVMVVDDHEVVRAGVSALVERQADMLVVESLGSGEDAIEALQSARPDVVVLDQRLPGISGAATCREILRRRPATAVVMLTTFVDDAVVHACIVAGARAFLLKGTASDELIDAIRATARGESVLAPEIVGRVLEWARAARAIHGSGPSLAPHEVVTLAFAAQGMTNREIARKLGVSEGSAKLYLRSVMRKLGVRERSEAVATGIRLGVI